MIFAFASSTTMFVAIFLTSFVVSLVVIFANSYNKKQQEKPHLLDKLEDDKDEEVDEDSDDEDDDYDEEDAEKAKLLVDAALLGLAFRKTSKKKNKKDNWETDCEFCGDLLEDCRCDHQCESRHDIGWWDCDDKGHGDDEDDRGDSFDHFRSL